MRLSKRQLANSNIPVEGADLKAKKGNSFLLEQGVLQIPKGGLGNREQIQRIKQGYDWKTRNPAGQKHSKPHAAHLGEDVQKIKNIMIYCLFITMEEKFRD